MDGILVLSARQTAKRDDPDYGPDCANYSDGKWPCCGGGILTKVTAGVFTMRKLLFFPVALLFGCFAPDLTGAMFLCDPSHFCPDGYSCVSGRCQIGNGGTSTGDGGASGPSGCADGMGSGSQWAQARASQRGPVRAPTKRRAIRRKTRPSCARRDTTFAPSLTRST